MLLVLCALAQATAQAQRQPGWEIRVSEKVELPGNLAIAIAVDRGLTVSKDAPVIVDLVPDGVTLKKLRLGRPDAVDPEADAPRFSVPIRVDDTAAAGKERTIAVRLRFWVCGGKVCKPLDERRRVTVVAPP